jgi:hypothetical protein
LASIFTLVILSGVASSISIVTTAVVPAAPLRWRSSGASGPMRLARSNVTAPAPMAVRAFWYWAFRSAADCCFSSAGANRCWASASQASAPSLKALTTASMSARTSGGGP